MSWGSTMWSSRPLALLTVLGIVGCDRNGRDLVQRPNSDFPAVLDLGELTPISAAEAREITQADCEGEDGTQRCVYGQLGTPEPETQGGATFTFKGTGGSVCVIVDPESVYWNQSISPIEPETAYAYPDNIEDDGDVDLFGGLSSYYTGSPGVNVGDFKGFYTDSQGNTVEIEYGECTQIGILGQLDAHAGRGAPEYCEIDTELREGVDFTIVLETFSTPLDDGVLSFSAMVVEGGCGGRNGISVTECTMPAEALDPETDEVRAGYEALEAAFCEEDMLAFCCANPDMCGDAPDGVCDLLASVEE